MPLILREENVEYSLLQAIREGLPAYGFVLKPEANATVDLREAFPTSEERTRELDITTLAFGFNIDDGGRPVELGSNLTAYVHTLMVWTFALEPRFGRRLALSVKHVVKGLEEIPLRDYNQVGDPQIDTLILTKVQVQHQANSSVRPWDRFVWTTSIGVQDTSYF